MLSKPFLVGIPLVTGALSMAACEGATEISLDVRTNLPCTSASAWRGIAVSVGDPGSDVESRAPVLTTTKCSASGEIGTLTIVPSGSRNAEVGIRVVAGLSENPEDCSANGYEGCVVSRRTITYLPHQTEHVLVDLTSDCVGLACDVNHTCVNGSCTDTVSATAPVNADGGVFNGGPTVRCGDDGTRCPVNDPSLVCCVSFDFGAGTGKGTCVPPSSCPTTSAVLYCDDSSDCSPIEGGTPVCCEARGEVAGHTQTTNTACQPASVCASNGGGITLCQDRQACPGSLNSCDQDDNAPGYYDCAAEH